MATSSFSNCLVCNSALTSNGQCPACDASKINRNTAFADLDSKRNERLGVLGDFQAADNIRGQNAHCPAFLFNKTTKERFQLSQYVSKVGRDRSNNISIPDDHYISRYHAWVLQNKGKFWLEDLGSTNGTLLNGRPITIRVRLSAGDRLTFGKTELIFVVE